MLNINSFESVKHTHEHTFIVVSMGTRENCRKSMGDSWRRSSDSYLNVVQENSLSHRRKLKGPRCPLFRPQEQQMMYWPDLNLTTLWTGSTTIKHCVQRTRTKYRSKSINKKCPQLADELFEFVEFVWNQEVLPTNMAIARFVMLYKHKGSANDPSKYRCIGLATGTQSQL